MNWKRPRPPLVYPPPPGFTATRIFSFKGATDAGTFMDSMSWDQCRHAAPELLRGYPELATCDLSTVTGSFGTTWVATWEAARRMDRTGLLDFEVDTKEKEMCSERLIGFTLSAEFNVSGALVGNLARLRFVVGEPTAARSCYQRWCFLQYYS